MDNIEELVLKCLHNNIKGDFLEAGCWKGGALCLMRGILDLTNNENRKVIGLDSFQGIPPAKPHIYPADEEHIGCENIPSLKNNSLEEVKSYLRSLNLTNIEIIEGWFHETLPTVVKNFKELALIRLDGDTYESTIQCLEKLEPLVSEGGYKICRRSIYVSDRGRTY